jgi:pimeloyl-ACP methyl ester carboxylesterase
VTPPVLLLHGALGAAAQLAPLADALGRLGGGRPVDVLEFEGHGGTAPHPGGYSIERFAEQVAQRLEARGIERAVLFGYSMGGYVALHLARVHPERVAAVATLGTKFRWDPETAAREAARLDAATIRAKLPRFAEALAARHGSASGGWEAVLARTAALLRSLGERPVLTDETLAQVAQPARVIVGDRDATVSVEEAAGAYRALPNGELLVLPRTPHPLEQVDAGRLAGALAEFFGGASPPGA